MARTLYLADQVYERASRYYALGQSTLALPLLRYLISNPEHAPGRLASAHLMAGECLLKLDEYGAARKHLNECLRIEPHNPQAHYCLAQAYQNDAEADASKAARHYREALRMAPLVPAFLSAAGVYFADMGQPRRGLKLLRQAHELAPDDLDVLRSLVNTLVELNREPEAHRLLNGLRFRLGVRAGFSDLVREVNFRAARTAQAMPVTPTKRSSPRQEEVLPFLNLVPAGDELPVRAMRRDAASRQRPHIIPHSDRFDRSRAH